MWPTGSFTAPTAVVTTNVGGFTFIPAQPNWGIDPEAGLAYDRTNGPHRGRTYLVYTDENLAVANDTNIFVVYSDDYGATWSDPIRVNHDSGVNSQFLPRIALDQSSGIVAVTWYDARNSLTNDTAQYFGAFSSDGGTTFGANFQISTGTSNQANSVKDPSVARKADYGDYTGNAFVNGRLLPAWADNSNSTQDNPDGATQFEVYTAVVQVQPPAAALGPDALLFGLLASGSITLARSSTVSFVNQSPAAPNVGAYSAGIAGPTSYLTGDLITAATTGTAITLANHDSVIGGCITGGGSVSLGVGAACGSTDISGTKSLLTTLTDAQSEAASYASYLAGLATTTNLGNITLKKYQSMTVKLGAGVNVVAIGNITTAGSNTITLSAPKSAVAVINVSGALDLGPATQVFTNSGGLNVHNVLWNLESSNPRFGANVTFSGTVLNEVPGTVTFGAGSLINGSVLTNGDVIAMSAMHLNFWPFTASPKTAP